MQQFVFSGHVKMNGVQFLVDAETEAEARAKITSGDWIDVETGGAEFSDWTVSRLISADPIV